MKELITEEQADLIVLLISVAVTVCSLAYGFYMDSRVEKSKKKLLWINALIGALVGPVIWVFWLVYNSIENYYGLDSLKALKFNFLIALALGALFFALFTYVPRWLQQPQAARRRK